MDKSKLKVFDVPFTTRITGTVKVLAEDERGAAAFVDEKVKDGSFGIDKDNLFEEGILHDGSMVFGSEYIIDPLSFAPGVVSPDDPKAHPDWDAYEDEEETNK